jgi:hypothetical protein
VKIGLKGDMKNVDKTTWNYISSRGADADLLAFLENRKLAVSLEDIAWRMKDVQLFKNVIEILSKRSSSILSTAYRCTLPFVCSLIIVILIRYVFNNALWSYSVFHNDLDLVKEYFAHGPVRNAVGPFFVSPLFRYDAFQEQVVQHKEYLPLVNSRAHDLLTRDNKSLSQS